MSKSICILNGHPENGGKHFCDALSDAYARGAQWEGHAVSRINIGPMDFGFLQTAEDYARDPAEPILGERQKIAEADHLVMIYPLWLGALPAKLKAFLEAASAGGFFLGEMDKPNSFPIGKMKGKSARLIVTMGMPGLAYRFLFGAHSLKATEQGIMKIAGFGPVRHTIIGMVEALGDTGRARVLKRVEKLGERGL